MKPFPAQFQLSYRIQRLLVAAILGFASSAAGGEIHQAVMQGGLTKIKSLLAADPNLLRAMNDDNSASLPIHLAAASNNTNVMAYLLEQGASIEATNGWGFTPLQMASYRGSPLATEMLLRAGASMTPMEPIGSPLHLAANLGYIEVARILLRYGAPVNAHSDVKETPLHQAAEKGHRDIAELLLNHGADKDAKGFTESTPLITAAGLGRHEIVQLLLERGANINAATDHGYTALSQAVRYGRTNCVEILLKHRPDLDSEDQDGLTPLGWCLQNSGERHSRAMALLLSQYGATKTGSLRKRTSIEEAAGIGDIERVRQLIKEHPNLVKGEVSMAGASPLHHAAGGGHIAIAELLLEAGSDVNGKDSSGFTPLHQAAKSGGVEMVKLLLSKNGNVNAKDEQDRTALHMAAFGGNAAVAKVLLAAGAKADSKDKRGTTPLEFATGMGNKAVADLLKQSLLK